jgi:hypothetical protein
LVQARELLAVTGDSYASSPIVLDFSSLIPGMGQRSYPRRERGRSPIYIPTAHPAHLGADKN